MSEDQYIKLETKLTYQEDLLQDLNELVTKQQYQLDYLTNVCKMLGEQLKEVLTRIPLEGSMDEKPPHY